MKQSSNCGVFSSPGFPGWRNEVYYRLSVLSTQFGSVFHHSVCDVPINGARQSLQLARAGIATDEDIQNCDGVYSTCPKISVCSSLLHCHNIILHNVIRLYRCDFFRNILLARFHNILIVNYKFH